MKILLSTLNSQYVHSNLALKYLYTVVAHENSDIEVREFTINNDPNYVYNELVRVNYDVVCFSCYIWNIEQIKKICSDLKLAKPSVKICLGGPEVSFGAPEFAKENPWVDYILCGEGEYSFYRFCQVLKEPAKPFNTVPGLVYRSNGKIYVNAQIEPINFSLIPFPYSVLECEADKVMYYESSRGCPFGCTYCLSSVDRNVRSLGLDRVKADLGYFLFKKVMQVKFVDRTFNYDRQRAYEILKYLMENDNGVTNFHFELCGDLIDEKTFELLSKARKGLFQVEIGIQSVNKDTLRAVNRKEETTELLANVKRLLKPGNIHVHVDLIAGLPYESFITFKKSFNTVYDLHANALQLGFLKVLKGSPIEAESEKFGIVSRKHPPYEVLSTDYITAEELVRLKMIEKMIDIYYNRGGFSETFDYLIGRLGRGAFGFYEKFSEFYYQSGFQHTEHKKEDQYRFVFMFATSLKGEFVGIEEEVQEILTRDMENFMNPDTFRRFLKKGWEF